MADNDTLLAHLIVDVRITRQVEVAATRSLAYILNSSPVVRRGMVCLINDSFGVNLVQVKRVVAEDTYRTNGGDGRADFVAYDIGNEKRIVGEAKFDAEVSPGQGGGYLHQLSKNGDAVLLFVVPGYRIDHLWEVVSRDIKSTNGEITLECEKRQDEIRTANLSGLNYDWHFMMVSWRKLLRTFESSIDVSGDKAGIKSDISQLLGLTERMDMSAVRQFEDGELENFARRWRDLTRLVNSAIENNSGEGEPFSTSGLLRSGSEDGYVRYFRYRKTEVAAWVGFSYKYWVADQSSALWFGLQSHSNNKHLTEETYRRVQKDLFVKHEALSDGATPIYVMEAADFSRVLEEVVSRLKEVGNTIQEAIASS